MSGRVLTQPPSRSRRREGRREGNCYVSGAWYTGAMQDLGAQIGSAVKTTRKRFGWSERELASRLSTNQAAVQRLEGGRQRHMDVRLANEALDLLGIRLSLDANPIGVMGRMEQRDLVHARCTSYVGGRLRAAGWDVRIEVEIGQGRTRGWIDLLAYRPSDGALLVIEIKTVLDDLGRILRTVGWYVRSARDCAIALGWKPRRIVPVLLVLASGDTDARLAVNAALVAATFTGRTVQLNAWITDPNAPAPAGTVSLIDPSSRRRAWLWATRNEGRR